MQKTALYDAIRGLPLNKRTVLRSQPRNNFNIRQRLTIKLKTIKFQHGIKFTTSKLVMAGVTSKLCTH